MEFIKNGGSKINAFIQEALKKSEKTLKLSGYYEVEEVILLPSHFRLVLEDCHLKLAEGTYCNLFRNEHAYDGIIDEDIAIEGRGFAILDGGVYNGFSEHNDFTNIMNNNLILFINVDNFKFINLHIQNERWYSFDLFSCTHGLIRDIDFQADDTTICPDGSTKQGLIHDDGSHYRVENADGIDVRAGCSDILIENITGFTEDDVLALNLLDTDHEHEFIANGRSHDIHNIIIRNIRACTLCAIIRVYNLSKNDRIYNILIDGVMDTVLDSKSVDRGHHAVRMDYCPSEKTDNYGLENFVVKNVYCASRYGIRLTGHMRNMQIENVIPMLSDTIALVHRGFGENIHFYSPLPLPPHRFPMIKNQKEDDTVKVFNAVGYYVTKCKDDGSEDAIETMRQKSILETYSIDRGIHICAWFTDKEGSFDNFNELVENPSLLRGYSAIVIRESRMITDDFTKYFNMQSQLYQRGVELIATYGDLGQDN